MSVPATKFLTQNSPITVQPETITDDKKSKEETINRLQTQENQSNQDLSRTSSQLTGANVSYAYVNGKFTPIGVKSSENLKNTKGVPTVTNEENNEDEIDKSETDDISAYQTDFSSSDAIATAYAFTAASQKKSPLVATGNSENSIPAFGKTNDDSFPSKSYDSSYYISNPISLNRGKTNKTENKNEPQKQEKTENTSNHIHEEEERKRNEELRKNKDKKDPTKYVQNKDNAPNKKTLAEKKATKEAEVKKEVQAKNTEMAKNIAMKASKTISKNIKVGNTGKTVKAKIDDLNNQKFDDIKINYVNGEFKVKTKNTPKLISRDKFLADARSTFRKENSEPTKDKKSGIKNSTDKSDEKDLLSYKNDENKFMNEHEKIYQDLKKQNQSFENAQRKADKIADAMNLKLNSSSF